MENELFPKLVTKALSDSIVENLRDAIIHGKLTAGSRLNETEVAKQMGVSRVPVREAISRLEHQGLIISNHNRGSFVRYFDQRDIVEIYNLRAVLEGLACQLIVRDEKLDDADFDLLQGLVEEHREIGAAGDYDAWVDIEITFHDFIMRKAGSPRLLKLWRDMHVQCLFATRANLQAYVSAYGSHPVILRALRDGDPEGMIPLHQEIYGKVQARALEMANP